METPRAQDLHSKSSSAYSPRARFSRSNLQQTRKPYAQISFMIAEMRSSSIMSGIAIMTWIIAPILASLASMSSCGDGKRRSGATCAAQIPSRLTGSQSHVSTRRQSTVLNEAHRHKKRSPKRSPEMVVAATAQSLPASNPGVRQSAAYRSYSRFIDFQ